MESTSRATLDEVQTIFAYLDAIDYQIVGNSKAMLLGLFPFKGVHGEQLSWQFNRLQYIDVSKSLISSISMQLCTPTGDPAPFLGGDSLCRLHFRRKLLENGLNFARNAIEFFDKRSQLNRNDNSESVGRNGNSGRAYEYRRQPFQITERWRGSFRL